MSSRNTKVSSATDVNPYGRSLKVVNGDLVLDENNTPVIIADSTNVGQGIARILQTPTSNNIFHPDFGLDVQQVFDLVGDISFGDNGSISFAESLEYLEVLLVQAILLLDDRVSSVPDVVITRDESNSRILNIDLTAVLTTEENLSLAFSLPITTV